MVVFHMTQLLGEGKGSRNLQLEYSDLCHDLFIDVNPIPVKEAMNMMGMNVGDCRLPLYKMTDAARETLRATLAKHGLV
jgi:4-hydroxy-tetrahydrodipicolinate synthase